MRIQVNTDNTIEGHGPLITHVESEVTENLARFKERLSRVEVHLNAINDHKHKGGEHRCLMEARIEGHPPIAASDHATSLHQAIHGAVHKLSRAIDSALGRIHDGAKTTPVIAPVIDETDVDSEESIAGIDK